MLKIFSNKTATNEAVQHRTNEDEAIRLDEQTVQRLLDKVESIRMKLERSKTEAARCLATPESVLPQELHAALIEQRADEVSYAEAVQAHQTAADDFFERQKEATERRAREDAAARKSAYETALADYRQQCAALFAPAFEVRRLAAAAGVYMPNLQPGDLLFDETAEVCVRGEPLQIWRHG